MKKFMLYVAAAVLLLTSCGRSIEMGEPQIIPQPMQITKGTGQYSLAANPKLVLDNLGQNVPVVKFILWSMRHSHMRPSLVAANETWDLMLVKLDTYNDTLGDEGYILSVNSNGITCSANTEQGLFYAYQTFIQMLPADISTINYRSIILKECRIVDAPRFAWRGVHFDVCRHYFDVKFIKKYLDVMAAYKMNHFHWHLTDDHGWRLPINSYPNLNTVGSWRKDMGDTPWRTIKTDSVVVDKATYGGFYSREEIAEVIEYAAARGIEVVPEIELPGHCSAILASYPNLSCDGDTYKIQLGNYWPPKAILCAGNDSTLTFLYAVLDEVMEMFPSQYIHLGGDEAWKYNWERCPKCQRRMKENHLQNEEQLQAWLVGKVAKYLEEHGKKAICWDEVTDGGATSNVTVMAWRSVENGVEAARTGHDVIMVPTSNCYLDYIQADKRFQPASFGHLTLEQVYRFNPVPDGVGTRTAAHILGGQCNLWTEYINTPSHAEYMLLPRMLAVSECVWSLPKNKDWNTFRLKVEQHKERLAAKGYNYCDGSFTPAMDIVRNGGGKRTVSFSVEVPNTYLFFTTDGSTPTRQSSVYISPLQVEKGTMVKILPVYKDIERDTIYEFEVK